MIKLILCAFWLLIVPYFLGKFLAKKSEDTVVFTWVLGHILQMAIFFVCAVPLILLKVSFNSLLYIYSTIILVLFAKSVISNRKDLNFKKFSIKDFIKNVSIYQIIFVVLFGALLFVRFEYSSVNDDDSSFIVLSNDMIESNKMYLTDSNGETSEFNARKVLAPLSAYYAVLSKQVFTHPTVMAHTVMPIVLICIAYSIYYYLAKRFFKEKDSIFIFLIFLHLLSLYTFDVKGYNRYFLLFTWFGRAILAAIILPLMWHISFDAMNKDSKFIDWARLFVIVNAGCLGSEMAVALIPISLCAFALVNSFREKKISYLLKSFVCILPCVLIAMIYLILK